MTAAARESIDGGGEVLPVVAPGLNQVLTVDAGATYAYVSFGTSPDPTDATARIRVAAGVVEYFKVTPGEKARARAGATTSSESAAFGDHTTVVRVLYDAGAGEVDVTEGKK